MRDRPRCPRPCQAESFCKLRAVYESQGQPRLNWTARRTDNGRQLFDSVMFGELLLLAIGAIWRMPPAEIGSTVASPENDV